MYVCMYVRMYVCMRMCAHEHTHKKRSLFFRFILKDKDLHQI